MQTKGKTLAPSLKDMILPKLSEQEIEKLDILFNTLKKGALEDNRHGFFPIDNICISNWGENDILYTCFANTLIDNNLTDAGVSKGQTYIWMQRCNQNGLAFDSFKNEYERQRKMQSKAVIRQRWEDIFKIFEWISKPILLLITILSILLNFYQFYIDNKNERLIQQKQQTIDSLELVANDLNAKYKAPTHTDTKAMQDSSIIGQ
jgi:hypothetical protein